MNWEILSLILFVSISAFSQENYLTYKGLIQEEKGESPIPYAHILFAKHPNMGAISLADGSFEVTTSIDDTLIISSMIHEVQRIPISQLTSDGNVIMLTIKNHQLADLVIYSDEELYKLLQNVIDHIPQNYPQTDHQLQGYYQEYSIANEEYGHTLEAYMTIENQDYSKKNKLITNDQNQYYNAPNKIKIQQLRRTDDNRHLLVNQYRSFSDIPMDIFLTQNQIYQKVLKPWSQNQNLADMTAELQNIKRDTAKMNHLYSLGSGTINGDTVLYLGLDWLPIYLKKEDKRMYLKSTIWTINKSNFAVLSIRDQLSEELKSTFKKSAGKNQDHGEIRYRKIGTKYYPFMIAKDRGFAYMGSTQTDFVSRKFIVQQVITSKQEGFIKGGKKLPYRKRFNVVKFKYDPQFWADIQAPKNSDPLTAVKAELGRYKSLEKQYEANERSKK